MPDTMHWDDRLRTGHLGLDLKHKQLATCLANVMQAQRDGRSSSLVNQLLLGLWKATECHFSEEEELMRRVNFPGLERHLAAHQRILQILAHKMHAYLDVSCDADSVTRTFHAWFTGHTVGEDAELGAFISGEHAQPAG
jgi:hemerythrin